MNSGNLSLNGIQTSLTYKKPTSNPVITLPILTTISTGPTAPALFRNQDYVLVAGDLNAKHASWSPIAQQNVAGHTIRRFCDSTGYSLNAPLEPTHFHKNLRNTVIDLAICKGMTITDVTSIPELSSDHNPVLFEVCLDNFTAPALSTYAFPNWKKFQDILTNSLPVGPMGLHYSTEDKVNLFADSLESSFQENPEPYDDDFIDHVEEKIENYMDRNARRHTAPLTSPEEVMDIILNLNNKKAPGQDGIKNIALKSLPLNAITYITKIFNRSLQFNYFPKEWKHAQITVLPKPKKDTKFAENYRPISLLSCLGKIYEKIILTRIIDHCDRNNIIPDFSTASVKRRPPNINF
ncbi:probable RNA-directed DNA polymerase from transposon X-element [Trichonephila clavipes]|uniref:Probable RNA-directed DNA polymerase from transposon X-element n=1 Tax=Trichonephila clavipes TaxID=2585209 RepID=A0A8X6WDM8_TRICX|nr:probable RNA-directed DNA polymerase from transposon X-element [Trichonephila clavipes]